MKSIITKISSAASLLCLATTMNAQINDLTPTANPSTICAGESTTISVPNSQNGVTYYLRNGSTVVGNPMHGNGTTLNFGTGNLNTTTTYNVLGDVNNYALDFDGIDDKVTTSYTIPATNTLTIEAWIFPRKTTGNRYFSTYSGGGTFGNGEWLLDNASATLNGQGLRFMVATASNVTSTVSVDNVVTLNAWNHIAATFNNGTMKLFVNGVEVATANASFLNVSAIASTLTMGEDRTTTGQAEYFDGKMDEVRIWTTARTAAELAANKDACLNGNETGLSAYYRMNDYQSATASENIAARAGTLTNMFASSDWVWGAPIACTVNPTQPGYALDFDGTNDRVTTTYNFPSASSSLTIEAWIYPRGTTTNRYISSYSGSNSFVAGEFVLDNASGTMNGRGIRFVIATTGNQTSTLFLNNALTLNAWNHVAIVFDSGVMRLYVGGTLLATVNASFSTIAANSSNITLGEDRSVGALEYFNGRMDEVRIWNTVRTGAEINAYKNTCVDGQAGLAAYYKLDDFASGIAIEEVAGDNGTLSNMDAASDWITSSNINCTPQPTPLTDLSHKTAVNFDGINDRIATNYEFPGSTALTLEAWLYPRATTVNRYISSYSGGGAFANGEMVLDNASSTQNGQGLRYIIATTGGAIHTLTVDNVMTLNAWNHVAVTFDAGVIKIYVNGVEVATNTASFSSIASSAAWFNFGEDVGGGATAEYFNGKIDDIRIWTVARTASEIANNRNSCLMGNEPGLDAYFQCNEGTGGYIYDIVNNEYAAMVAMALATAWVPNDGLLCNDSNFGEMQLQMSQTVTVTVNPVATTNQTFNECAGFSIMVGSNTYSTSGTYVDTLVAASSCDSIVTTNLTVANAIDVDVTLAGTTLTADQTGATYQWLDCNNGNAPISGATSQSFEPTANGDYAVEITVGNCSETTSCFNVTGVGIDQIATPITWSVFPNPASNKLNIKTSEWTNIAIVNVLGQEMHTVQVQGSATIDISNFENGVYFVRNLNNNSVVKIVKN